jgi:hypothetical protein
MFLYVNRMTDQEPDIIKDNGETVTLLGYPLEYYFEKHTRPPFQFRKTSVHRGYVATWGIKGDKLYLVSLEGILEGEKRASVADLFPGRAPPILADFIDGDIAIGRGKATRQGWNFIYEHEETLKIKAGKVVSRKPLKR